MNNHEGDWEHINVVIDSQIPEDADIIKVDYYFHHYVLTRYTPGVDFYTVDNTHPVIFVGGYSGLADGWGSHGCYSIMGAWTKAAYDPNFSLDDDPVYILDFVVTK